FDDYANGKRCLNTSTPIFDAKGNVWRVIASIRDMTELETLQRKLTDLEMETLTYKARLQNLETAMDAGFVGHSAQIRTLRKEAAKAARTEAITLILGETGTGKTLTAKSIHDMSSRNAAPFIAINCGAIPMSLMESELFGYEKGAFTGAAKGGKPGMFELAHKGTLLLDEIGELPLPMQAKLLQVLDGHPFHRVGGTKPIVVDVRVLAATNKPLAEMVSGGQFREDLFYRLRVLTVEIPPLRERTDDIPVLAMHFLQEIAAKNALNKKFDPLVLNCFLTYPWPGNVRELRAIVQSLATMSEGEIITMQDLPQYMQAASYPAQPTVSFRQPLREAVAELEKNMIMTALAETGSTYKAARRLHVSQSTVVRKAQRYKLGFVEIGHQ
ncbi:MAG: sigma 54-interacting transcriptional regulator, partial [Bilophila sp.]